MDLNEYTILDQIGEGMFSKVFRVIYNKTGEEFAMKKTEYTQQTQKQKDYADEEIKILKKINHPNIISFEKSFISDDFLYVIMELASKGDLQNKITEKKEKGESFSVNEVLNITYQITLGLQDLHNKNIIHRDIKPANIFITNKDVIKIGDFNVGKNNPIAMKNTRIGTPLNMSPEVFYGKPYDFKADIWSLGCVVYEMTTLQKPFDADNEAVLFSKLEDNKIKKLKIPRSKALEILINKLMSWKPEKRPSCAEILAFEEFKTPKKEENSGFVRRTENKSKASSRVPNLVNLTISKEIYSKKSQNSPTYSKPLMDKKEILKPLFNYSREFYTNKQENTPEVSPHHYSFRKPRLTQENALKRMDSQWEIPRDLSCKNINTSKNIILNKTPSSYLKKNAKSPINFAKKGSLKNLEGKNHYFCKLQKSSSRIVNNLRTKKFSEGFLKDIYTVNRKVLRNKSLGSALIGSKMATPKILKNVSSLCKVNF